MGEDNTLVLKHEFHAKIEEFRKDDRVLIKSVKQTPGLDFYHTSSFSNQMIRVDCIQCLAKVSTPSVR